MLDLSYYPNLAADAEFREHVESELAGMMAEIRDNRTRAEEKWKRFYRIFNGELDGNTYSGRSKIYVAALRQASETFVSSIVKELFPGDDWFRVKPKLSTASEQNAENLTAVFKHYYQGTQQNLKSDALPFIRQLVMYGTSPGKLLWIDEEDEIPGHVRVRDIRGNWVLRKKVQTVKTYYGPRFKPIDLFNFYVWPETIDEVRNAQVAFEDLELPLSHLTNGLDIWVDENDPSKGHFYEFDKDEIDGLVGYDSKKFQARKERLSRLGIDKDPSERWSRLSKLNRYNVTEMFITKDWENGDGEKKWLVTLVNDSTVIRVQQNPLWDKQNHFLVPRFQRVLNEFYGRGIYEVSDRVQYMINDIVNQTMDSIQYEMNPITLIDPSSVSFAQSLKAAPGARWLVDHNGVEFTKPAHVATVGFSAFQMLLGILHDTTASAAQQGVPAVRGRGRAQNTASGMSQMLNQSSVPLSAIIEDIEAQWLVPLLHKTYKYVDQFMDEEILLRVLGREGAQVIESRKVNAVDLVGDYEFAWLGAISLKNRLVLGQQMINFLNIARGLPPQLIQSLNWKFLVERVWVDALGLKDVDQLFTPGGAVFSVSPQLELELLEQNREIKVSPADDHMGHLRQHSLDYAKMKEGPVKVEMGKHIDETMKTIQSIWAQQQREMQMQAIAQAQMQEQAQRGKKPSSSGQAPSPRPQNQPSGFQENGMAALAQQLQGGGIQ